MDILCHRGWHISTQDANSLAAFRRAFDRGWGVELDIRDHNGQLVISHDIPRQPVILLEELLSLYRQYFPGNTQAVTLAMNVKSTQLQTALAALIRDYDIEHYFVFDMAVPDHWNYTKTTSLRCFTRHSDKEVVPVLYEESDGVWLDELEKEWFAADVITKHLVQRKSVAIVSPELHHREHQSCWKNLRDWTRHHHAPPSLLLCTDYPEQAYAFFN